MSAPIPLSSLPVGGTAILQSYPKSGAAFLRLREMGLLPGVQIMLVRTAPLGDPIEIKVRGYRLTLRKTEAAEIVVAPTLPN